MSQRLLGLLDTLFASLLDDPPWISFLEALEHELPGHYGTMVLRKPRVGDPGVLISARGNNAAVSALQERVFSDSPFLELPPEKICILSEMMSEAELRARHPDYYEYMRQYGDAVDLIGVDLQEPLSGMTFRLRAARMKGEPNFGAAERTLLESLLPHLRTAVALYGHIARQEVQLSFSDQAVDQLAIGSLVLDERGVVLLKNTVADRILRQEDGLSLQDGQLHCTDADSEKQLYSLLRQVQKSVLAGDDESTSSQSLQVLRGPGAHYWSLLLRPSRARPGLKEAASATVLVLLRDASLEPAVSSGILMELFGLTRAEAKLAERLVKGDSLSEAAEELGRSRYTARAQLAAIFDKTGIHRQPQLVSHILNTVNRLWG